MTASTNKKVVIWRFEREPVAGLVNPRAYLSAGGVEVLTQAGAVAVLPFAEVKVVCFVRDFGPSELPAGQRVFQARPKTEGLWVRMRFLDGDILEGLLPNNLLHLEPYGFTVTPPNPTSTNQRMFVPRSALSEFQVLGVVGSPLRPRRRKPVSKTQLEMFE
ncbi:MAG: hypothetical protein IT159_07605 [Bryobacterales bacterium]|nr:hypothetical protein [Bryobacterales bacterium]